MYSSQNGKYYDIFFYKSSLECQHEDNSWKSDESTACLRADMVWNGYVWQAYVYCLKILSHSATPLILKWPHMPRFETQFSAIHITALACLLDVSKHPFL